MNKKSKYNNQKTYVDNIKFDSKKEADRYLYLKSQQEQGNISNLELQKKFELIPKQEYKRLDGSIEKIRPCHYVADFSYIEQGIQVVEDIKGFSFNKNNFSTQTEAFKIKRKLFILKYGSEIDFRII